jgi:hypothetical protein
MATEHRGVPARRRAAGALAAILLAVAAACSSAHHVDPVADLAAAGSATLRAGDLPGFTATPHTAAADMPPAQRKAFAACVGQPASVFDRTAGAQRADSPDFSMGTTQISNSVEIDPSRAGVDLGWTSITAVRVPQCLATLFGRVAAQSLFQTPTVSIGRPAVTRFAISVPHARATGLHIAVPIVRQSAHVTLYFDLLFAQRARAGITLLVFSAPAPFDRARERSLLGVVLGRVGNAAG